MKGTMVKCLQCNTVSVYMTDRDGRDRCPICRGYVMPQGECNIVDERVETTVLYGDGEAIETMCARIDG